MRNARRIFRGARGQKGAPPSLRGSRFNSISEIRAATPLPDGVLALLDNSLVRVGRDRLALIARLIDLGLVKPLPNWLAVPELAWDSIDDTGHAQRTMYLKSRGERQVPDLDREYMPIPITWDDFSFRDRDLAVSERLGMPLDTTLSEMSTRRVNEAIEDQGFNGLGFNVRGNTAPGILTHPGADTYEFLENEAWTDVAHTGGQIIADVKAMVQLQIDRGFPGPYDLYLGGPYNMALTNDYKDSQSTSILAKIQDLRFGGRPIEPIVADMMPANTVALVQTTSDVIDLIDGQRPAVISWTDGPGWEFFFAVVACMNVRIRSNIRGETGIVIGTPGS